MSNRLNITIQGACTTEVETETTLFNFVRSAMVTDGIIPSLYDLLTNAELVNGVNNFVLVCLFFWFNQTLSKVIVGNHQCTALGLGVNLTGGEIEIVHSSHDDIFGIFALQSLF